MSTHALLVVPYDYGSLSPLRLAEAAGRLDCSLLFVAADSPHAQEMLPVLQMAGSTINSAGMDEIDIARAVKAFAPAGITTFSEGRIAPTARLAGLLGLPYHSLDDVGAITCKGPQRQRLRDQGVESVRFAEVTRRNGIEAALAQVGLPAVVKPASGAASRHTTPVYTEAECLRALSAILDDGGHAVLEELLVGAAVADPWGDYLAVDCLASTEEVRPLFVTSKFALAEPYRERGGFGRASPAPDPMLDAAKDLACAAVWALGIRTGIADVELKLTDEGPRVIEVNGRLGGWVDDLAVRSANADPADTAIRAALGYPPTLRPAPRHIEGAIAFHYLIMPPVWARCVRAVRDELFSLRALPGIERVLVTTEPGARADWRIGTDGGVAAVLGNAPSHDRLAEMVARIEGVDWIDYD